MSQDKMPQEKMPQGKLPLRQIIVGKNETGQNVTEQNGFQSKTMLRAENIQKLSRKSYTYSLCEEYGTLLLSLE